MVRAIDVKTIGLGGDSEISITAESRIAVGPQRIVPISLSTRSCKVKVTVPVLITSKQ